MSKAIEFLRQLATQLQTQDNAYTASPNYCIQEHVQVTGIDLDYAPNEGWFNSGDEYQQADDKKAKALDRYYERYGKEPEGWTKLGYEWQWKYTGTNFLTHDEAHAYVNGKGRRRHSGEIRVYVDSHYRNREMREVRRLLAGPVIDCIESLAEIIDAMQACAEDDNKSLADTITEAMEDRACNAMLSLTAAKEPHQ